MYKIDKIIDFSVWTGNWPFDYLKYREPGELKKKLESQGVVKAFIAPIEGILERDPIRANRKLLEEIKDEFFSPVPIVDLSYKNWEQAVELALGDKRVKMLKLLPNYHMYELTEERLEKLIELTLENKLLISVQVRVEDKRGQYPLMKVEDVDVLAVSRVLSYFPQQIFILNNVYIGEIAPFLHSLDNVYVDISSVEHQNVLRGLYKEFKPDRFLFSSHSPFYYPEGNIFKLKYSDLEPDEIDKVAYKNGERLLEGL